jgi:hypothetical protein
MLIYNHLLIFHVSSVLKVLIFIIIIVQYIIVVL